MERNGDDDALATPLRLRCCGCCFGIDKKRPSFFFLVVVENDKGMMPRPWLTVEVRSVVFGEMDL